MSLTDATIQFATDEQCLAYLEAMRWPDIEHFSSGKVPISP